MSIGLRPLVGTGWGQGLLLWTGFTCTHYSPSSYEYIAKGLCLCHMTSWARTLGCDVKVCVRTHVRTHRASHSILYLIRLDWVSRQHMWVLGPNGYGWVYTVLRNKCYCQYIYLVTLRYLKSGIAWVRRTKHKSSWSVRHDAPFVGIV